MAHFVAVQNEMVRATDHATWTVNHGNTGRVVVGDDAYVAAKEWSGCATLIELLSHAGAERFRDALTTLRPFAGVSPRLYRGLYPHWKSGEPTCDMMGPPDASRAGEGRYNRKGRVALYLGGHPDGIILEIGDRDPSAPIYVQEFGLPSGVKIADCAARGLDPFINSVLQLAEECMLAGRGGPDNYMFSQIVAEMMEAAGFDGMLVPGVRGSSSFQYHNVVVFSPHPVWPSWLVRTSSPRRIR